MVPAYDYLIAGFSDVIGSNEAALALRAAGFEEELRHLIAGRAHAEKVAEDSAAASGSKNRRERDLYLHVMVYLMELAIGNRQTGVLLELINAACAANDKAPETHNPETLQKRVKRYRDRYGSELTLEPMPCSPTVSKEE